MIKIMKQFDIGKRHFAFEFLLDTWKRGPSLKEIDAYLHSHYIDLYPWASQYEKMHDMIGRVKALRAMCPEYGLKDAVDYIRYLISLEEV